MRTTAVGLTPAHPDALRLSHDFLARHTGSCPYEVVELSAAGALGFNELVGRSESDVVLIQGGALVGPDWLTRLTAALARTGAGLAGPSTNRAWNEQGCVDAAGDLRGVRTASAALARRFGTAARTLAPLHSLGDFCYLVRREVVDVLGGADPAYGEGPCWEMDYNIRATRAGFPGVWVGGAFVWRPAPADDSAQLEPARRLYQDRFCGQRLAGDRDDYRQHCLGDECTDFAPLEMIKLRVDALVTQASTNQATRTPVTARQPVVSCVMPTRGRPQFALRAVEYFLRQDYAEAELVVVEDGTPQLATLLPANPRVRLVRPPDGPGRRSIGALRNLGCAAARGQFIVLFDDDDWHGPRRVSTQLGPLLAGTAEITGLEGLDWFEPVGWQCWRPSPGLESRLLRRGVYGGTIAFARRWWEHHRFPDRSLAEDADFLDACVRAGARLTRVPGREHYVYVRHAGNTWSLQAGQAVDRDGWSRVAAPDLPSNDLAFYAGLDSPQTSGAASGRVSCIMPTRDRRSLAALAIAWFRHQDYPDKELVVLDDGDIPIGDLVAGVPGVRYQRLDKPVLLGTKRNLACELATGDFIAHWDDDDWQAPTRLSTQVHGLASGRAELSGTSRLLFWDAEHSRAWRYTWPTGARPWLAGTSLCYAVSLWRRHPFPAVGVGEDTRFVWQSGARELDDLRSCDLVVALLHSRSTVRKDTQGPYWAPVDLTEVRRLLGDDYALYHDLLPRAGVLAAVHPSHAVRRVAERSTVNHPRGVP